MARFNDKIPGKNRFQFLTERAAQKQRERIAQKKKEKVAAKHRGPRSGH
jgi:hypothetical protein